MISAVFIRLVGSLQVYRSPGYFPHHESDPKGTTRLKRIKEPKVSLNLCPIENRRIQFYFNFDSTNDLAII